MTMTIRISNLGPKPYHAKVVRAGSHITNLSPGETVEVSGWKDGEIIISEISEEDLPPSQFSPPNSPPTNFDLCLLAAARAAHEANRAWCMAHGDTSQLPWDAAPEWARSSAIKGVQGVLAGNGPEQSHESWLEEKKATGWKYGPVKNVQTKEHPCFVPYAELPPEQKAKDHIFVNVARAFIAAFGDEATQTTDAKG